MSTLEDLTKLGELEQDHRSGKGTLLERYNIPIQHFEFDYVKSCSDGKELEKILLVLRSGEEGHYPDLTNAVEERLEEVKPRSKLLRKAVPVIDKHHLAKSELEELCDDLKTFVTDVSKMDKELLARKTNCVNFDAEVRGRKQILEDVNCNVKKEERLKSTDYTGWDKYDPDTELLKMELKEENDKNTLLERAKKKKTSKKSVSFNNFGTEAEASFISDREREKGNEFFKTGEYEEALLHYTTSIQSKSNINNLNNRAATYLKLKKYQEAICDCESVFTLDQDNLKAHLRKAVALEHLDRFEEALETVEFVIRVDPNNCAAQDLAERVREHCSVSSSAKNTRMKIVEIE